MGVGPAVQGQAEEATWGKGGIAELREVVQILEGSAKQKEVVWGSNLVAGDQRRWCCAVGRQCGVLVWWWGTKEGSAGPPGDFTGPDPEMWVPVQPIERPCTTPAYHTKRLSTTAIDRVKLWKWQ